jgi:hypothetical protein
MSERVNAFADINQESPVFTTKPKAAKPVDEETIVPSGSEDVEDGGPKAAYLPDRSQCAIQRQDDDGNYQQDLYKLAAEKKVPLGELLRLAADALDPWRGRKGKTTSKSASG